MSVAATTEAMVRLSAALRGDEVPQFRCACGVELAAVELVELGGPSHWIPGEPLGRCACVHPHCISCGGRLIEGQPHPTCQRGCPLFGVWQIIPDMRPLTPRPLPRGESESLFGMATNNQAVGA